jgi:hypothetical protein
MLIDKSIEPIPRSEALREKFSKQMKTGLMSHDSMDSKTNAYNIKKTTRDNVFKEIRYILKKYTFES